jgi:CheY-like chemotaxis protein
MDYNWVNKKVLIVEDTYANCLLLEHILNPTGIGITIVNDSGGFFNTIEDGYDLILMDVNLGEMITGIDLVKYMNRNDIEIPVILQTAYDVLDLDIADIKYNGLIRKPISPKKLLDDIYLILN